MGLTSLNRRSSRKIQARPVFDCLESRQLLHARLTLKGGPINDQDLRHFIIQQVVNQVPVTDRRIEYTTPQGSHVLVTLYGVGSLAGSTILPDGSLDLVYAGTNAISGIVGKVTGGNGRATLHTMHDATEPFLDLSGSAGDQLGPVNLKQFDLAANGDINLSGGVNKLLLNSVGPNSQIHLKSLASPPPAPPGGGGLFGAGLVSANPPSLLGLGTGSGSGSGSSSSSSGGTSGTGSTGGGGGSTAQQSGELAALPTGIFNPLTGIGTGASSQDTLGSATGIDVVIAHIHGAPRDTPAFQDAEIFGYDPVLNALVRFDAENGAVLQVIPVSGMGTPISGVAMARDFGNLVALIGDGTTIQAYDAITGTFVGQFSTASLASEGFHTVDGIGSTDFRTVVSDSSAGTHGMAQLIDVSRSLASGQVVTVGAPFAPQNEFDLSGGATGVAGSELVHFTGAARFNSFTPDQTQFGILNASTNGRGLTQTSISQITKPASIVSTGPPGEVRKNPTNALGSLDQDLALITDNQNTVTFYDAKTLAVDGTVQLADPNRITGLSESFHPELVGDALVDVRGDLRSFRALDATGLVLNVSGTLSSLVQIHNLSDSVIIGRPVTHVNIPKRNRNVFVLSTDRINTTNHDAPLFNRGGVTLVTPNLPVIGPLSLPTKPGG